MFEDNNLEAKKFTISKSINTTFRFKELMLNIYKCYELMIEDNQLVPNLENNIRDMLLYEYLNNNEIRQKLNIDKFLFDPEVPEKISKNSGRTDIKIQTYDTFQNTDNYYIIECKRLDGYSKLNKEYINNGINRFIKKEENYKYSSYNNINGMIGFVVKNIDIDKNIYKMGNFFEIIELNKLYHSNHLDLELYHLMMDFSDNF